MRGLSRIYESLEYQGLGRIGFPILFKLAERVHNI